MGTDRGALDAAEIDEVRSAEIAARFIERHDIEALNVAGPSANKVAAGFQNGAYDHFWGASLMEIRVGWSRKAQSGVRADEG